MSSLFDAQYISELRTFMDADFPALMRTFDRDTATRVSEVSEFAQQEDWAGVLRASHAIKGMSANVGAFSLESQAVAIVQAIRAQRYEEIDGLIKQLASIHSQLAVELKSILAEDN
jgi:HPt (histidine-containing phosphotransfer) domain-containing protein